ncbi:uncharacterized protein TRIADDRAFT_61265 [Trichoplax adhaerens]|uniref:F-box domain-containing protein n=1 Tax=Trichoplax adhaerens TaxID=10228 RepID=B3SAH9_TRIAD|nr:hypothetical protein TRIADDRAFT_61265 [Trichoplax adhaerens]EDV20264.1 hypothetical protein TRIADDRAFT_61265 [Trichoplax adhaerens]|eukprot:XP_002117214.1 hypothetical protein TRIADDRAFT_61265 [Trichoplax adhaerens]
MADEHTLSYFSIFTLPNELIVYLFRFLHGVDLARLCMVCRWLNHFIAHDEVTWKQTIHAELTTSPLMLIHETHKDFYKRAYLGLYRYVTALVIPPLVKEFNNRAKNADHHVRNSYFIEKNYSYGHYLNEYALLHNTSIMDDPDRSLRLYCYLCAASKHGYEVWATKLCQQGAKLTESNISIKDWVIYDWSFCPLGFATYENNVEMVKTLIKLGIRYQSPDPQYVLQIDNNLSIDSPVQIAALVALRGIICKVLVSIRDEAYLLKVFLKSLSLPSYYQAVFQGDLHELNRLTRDSQVDLDTFDDYYMTALSFSILIGREDVARYIYKLKKNVLIGNCIADFVGVALADIEFKVLEIIREHDFDCYKAVVFNIFADEKYFTASSHKDVLQIILSDLNDENIFYEACQSAITSQNSRIALLLLSDLPKLLQLRMNSVNDEQELLRQIVSTRKNVIANYGKELILHAAAFRQGHCIRVLITNGAPLLEVIDEVTEYSCQYLGSFIEIPNYFVIASNSKYKLLHQFLWQLSNANFDVNAIIETLQFYTFAKEIADLPICQTTKQALNKILPQIILRIMHCDWRKAILMDSQLQTRLDKISYTLLENLMFLSQNYDVNARHRCNIHPGDTALFIAARSGNVAWIQLFLQAGADRQIKNYCQEKLIHCIGKPSKECMHLIKNYNSCPLPSKPY